MEGNIIFLILTMEKWMAEDRSSAFNSHLNVILKSGMGLTPKWNRKSENSPSMNKVRIVGFPWNTRAIINSDFKRSPKGSWKQPESRQEKK